MDDFFKELEENDKLVSQENLSYKQQNKIFNDFIVKNKCKIKGGAK